jgi:CRP-like cAMP-binding protein
MTSSRKITPPATDLLVARLGKLAPLTDHERNVLRLIESRARHSHRPDTRLVAEGREVRAPHVVLSGWAARMRELSDGRRQIFGIVLPGDTAGLSPRIPAILHANISALTPMRTIEAPEIAVAWRDRERVPGIAQALDHAAAEDEHFLFAQIMRLGRQTAYERVAHLVMELDYRLDARGLTTNDSFPMPLTQETLADAVGLSVVHVNRTLQQMRREGRIELAHGRLAILDRAALTAAAEFVPLVLTTTPQLADAAVRSPAGPGEPVTP